MLEKTQKRYSQYSKPRSCQEPEAVTGQWPSQKDFCLELHEKVEAIPFQYCNNVRTLVFKIGVPKSSIHDALKKGLLKHTGNSSRLILTDKNKAERVNYSLSFVQDGQFTDILERVDVDKKWFYLTEVAASYILVPGETPHHQTYKHKSHIKKAMCLTTIVQP
jgi:hypothetical protein